MEMFTNIGEKIKKTAFVIFILGVASSVAGGIVLCVIGGILGFVIGLFAIPISAVISWIFSLFVFGFGDLCDAAKKFSDLEPDISKLETYSRLIADHNFQQKVCLEDEIRELKRHRELLEETKQQIFEFSENAKKYFQNSCFVSDALCTETVDVPSQIEKIASIGINSLDERGKDVVSQNSSETVDVVDVTKQDDLQEDYSDGGGFIDTEFESW